jgi:hypothetical protein
MLSSSMVAQSRNELDALLSASRRAYDKIGQVVWAAFERRGQVPDNVAGVLKRSRSCPKELAERFGVSWALVGRKLKDYRDCTQHYASTPLGTDAITKRRLDGDLWGAWARIPDNPEVRAKGKFTYALELDALTYGWEVSNEVILLAAAAMAAAADAKRPADKP